MTRPNILFIMADDHAAKAISCYGGGLNHTPHLDSLHTNGARLDSCYVTNSICTPSRATILTGTHNHVNCVHTLASHINNLLPNVAKHIRAWGDYQTAMVGKWHLGEGPNCSPEGSFDYWDVLPGQGKYFNPDFIRQDGRHVETGYVTDIITDKSLQFLDKRDPSKPFFLMCHHKAPHRMWEYNPAHKDLYSDEVKMPETFNDDYKTRARAASSAKMRVEGDLTYADLGLVQPEEGNEVVLGDGRKKITSDHKGLVLVDRDTGEKFSFETAASLSHFKYQRYLRRYLRTIQSIDDNVGRMLDYLKTENLLENTYVIYTSDQGFFLGEHGWFDKRFIYEESFQMPFLIQGPGVTPGSVCTEIVSNVDFAPTFLDLVGLRAPTYMQGRSFRRSLLDIQEKTDSVAYHRYWMHADKMHNAYAHYGIRNDRYKLIFWYNLGYSLPGTSEGGEQQEWEFFDCHDDPMELLNLWSSSDEEIVQAKEAMIRRLEREMETIGDIPAHPIGLSANCLMTMFPPNALAERGKQTQRNM